MLDFTNRKYYIVRAGHYQAEKTIKSLKNSSINIKIHFNKYREHNLQYPWKFMVSVPKTDFDILYFLITFYKTGWLDFREVVPRQFDDITLNSYYINEIEVYRGKEEC